MIKKQLTTDEAQEVVEVIKNYIIDLKNRWDLEKPPYASKFMICREYLTKGTLFILKVTDEMIQFVEGIIPNGKDKKETVLLVAGSLFDYIIICSLPIWLKPMSGLIRKIVIEVLFSEMIEFIVEKYSTGYWKVENEEKKS